ncbi:MAG: class I SAM-dependent methyltransferase [Acidobacteria bacterium]|nr:class I SAM-dependent methyltransferase [Acidobacteriota bacterium]
MEPLHLLGEIGLRFRRRRMERLLGLFPIDSQWRVLDVGGTPAIWEVCPVRPRLVLLNQPRAYEQGAGADWVQGDGCRLPFRDQSFDLVFSNSVIEHLGSEAAMRSFAAEVRRVGVRYFVQTPDAAFPVEPHLYTPFLHQLPRGLQRRLAPRFSLWSLLGRATPDEREFYIRHYLEEIRLLHAEEMRSLFPGGRIVQERFLGLSKSLIAHSA